MSHLSAERVQFSYRTRDPILRDITFSIDHGEFVSLVGPNGSGKTTLLRLFDRIYVPDAGRVILDGRDIQSFTRSELARLIGFVPHDFDTAFPFTALETVLMGRFPHMGRRMYETSDDLAVAREALRMTDVAEFENHPVTTLSGGERQRVLIARALAQSPSILLLDEPNAHLDVAHQLDLFSLLQRLHTERNLTIIAVTHDLNLAAAFSDRIAVLHRGVLRIQGTPHEVLTTDLLRTVFGAEALIDQHPTLPAPRITLTTRS